MISCFIVINELNRIKSNITMKLLHFGYDELDLFDKRIIELLTT